ncbi:MAG: helix-turn-helix domain-containing protein [Streptosporangiaceae bacterium]
MSPVNVTQIGSYIRDQREQAKISIRQLAQAAGVSNPYLSQIERGLRKPSADILQQIAKGLRISAEALYVQAGLLDDQPGGLAVRTAVLADDELTERQKQMLIEIYDSFRKETAMAAAEADEAQADEAGADPGDEEGIAVDGAAFSWPEDLEPEALAAESGSGAADATAGAALAGEPAAGEPAAGKDAAASGEEAALPGGSESAVAESAPAESVPLSQSAAWPAAPGVPNHPFPTHPADR